MNRYIAEIIDKYALYDLNKKRSKKSHFSNLQHHSVKADSLHDFYPIPKLPNVTLEKQDENEKYTIGRFSYNSEIENDPSNKNSVGIYYENKYFDQTANVIIVHGWKMNSLKRVEDIYLNSFSNLGFNMYYFTLPYHFEREPEESLYSGELMISADIDRSITSVKQAVTDLRAFIKWVRANRKGKIILIGLSLGGFITNLTSVLEKDIDMLISTFYANSIAYSIWNTIPGKYIKKDFEQSNFTYEQLKQVWTIINPAQFKPVVQKENILLISGIYDQFVVLEDTSKLWESWGRPKRILYDCGHSGIVLQKRRISKDTVEFIKERL